MPSCRIFTVRHGQSVDNLMSSWAGWKDSPLCNHGMNQAKRVGVAFSKKDVQIDAIYSSDLLRAHWTGQQIWQHYKRGVETADEDTDNDGNDASEPPVITDADHSVKRPITTTLLREQNFGKGEGAPWDSGKYSDPSILTERDKTFEDGETLNDVSRRVSKFIESVIKPWLIISRDRDVTLVLTSHGIAIAELTHALQTLDPNLSPSFLGALDNTSYHELLLSLPTANEIPDSAKAEAQEAAAADQVSSEPFLPDLKLAVKVEVVKSSVADHLKGLERHTNRPRTDAEARQAAEKEKFFGGYGGKKKGEPAIDSKI